MSKMTIERAPNNDIENSTLLGNLNPSDTFRFATLTFDQAISEEEFYIVVEAPEKKDRIMVVNLSTGGQKLRDKEHRVVQHQINTQVIE